MTASLRPAGPADVQAVAHLVAAAFHPLAAVSWLVPEPEHRARILTDNFAIVVAHAITYGRVCIAGDTLAAAVWLPGGPDTPTPDNYQHRLAQATGAWADRFRVLDRLMAANHPGGAHQYLALLGVHPDHQRHGYGSALLEHTHHELDRTATPAYLEAASIASCPLYERHGYRPRHPFHLPDGTPFFPMWRPPAHAGTPPPSGSSRHRDALPPTGPH